VVRAPGEELVEIGPQTIPDFAEPVGKEKELVPVVRLNVVPKRPNLRVVEILVERVEGLRDPVIRVGRVHRVRIRPAEHIVGPFVGDLVAEGRKPRNGVTLREDHVDRKTEADFLLEILQPVVDLGRLRFKIGR